MRAAKGALWKPVSPSHLVFLPGRTLRRSLGRGEGEGGGEARTPGLVSLGTTIQYHTMQFS